MDYDQRLEFWKTLCSLTGDDPQADAQQLKEKIVLPKFLFRYRAINNNNLEALRTNQIYFSKASRYDDPFDTFLHIDINKLQEEFESNFTSEQQVQKLAQAMSQLLSSSAKNVQDEYREQFKKLTTSDGLIQLHNEGIGNQFLVNALMLRTWMQERIQSICFSENGFNETLWLKYADQHRGFALMYNLLNNDHIYCGKLEECKNCGINIYGVNLYPVFYSDTPYIANDFAKAVMIQNIIQGLGVPMPNFLKQEATIKPFEKERISLIKKKCHEYDEEWRMISKCLIEPKALFNWAPEAVILGLRTSTVDANLIITLARQAGIKKFYKSIIDKENKLNAQLIQLDT